MGFLDNLKDGADKAADLAAEHAEKIDDGIDKVAEVVDDKTGRAHTDKIDAAADKAHDALDDLAKDRGKA